MNRVKVLLNATRLFTNSRCYHSLLPLSPTISPIQKVAYLHTSSHLNDWIRRNTPRKPTIHVVEPHYTLLEEEKIHLNPSHLPKEISPTEEALCQDCEQHVNLALQEEAFSSRMFAIVKLSEWQYKVTEGDLISIPNTIFPADVGDSLRLEKVLAVGNAHFSLIGRPLLDLDKVFVYAQVVEKTLDRAKLWFQFHAKRRHKKMRVRQENLAILRITGISVERLPN